MQFELKSYAWFRFEITTMISDQNLTTRGSITTLLSPLLNCPNTGLGQFKYFINAVLSWFEIEFIHFLGKKKSFGNNSCKICHIILFVFHFPAILLVTLNKPWNLIGCFVFSVGSSLAGKKRQFKAKMVRFAPIRANQTTGTTSDFKMGVIERGIALVHEVILFRFYVTVTTIVKLSQSFLQNHFHLLMSQK